MGLWYTICWYVCRGIFRILFRARIFHADRVPTTGPVLLAANHASFMDPPLIGSSVRREINYLARETLFKPSWFGALLRSINVIPVDRDGRSPRGLKVISERLEAGWPVILFPEGTRTSDGQLQPVKPGVGLLAIRSEAAVVPVRVFGTFEAYGRHQRWPSLKSVAVTFGEPLDMRDLRDEALTASKPRVKEIYSEATERIMKAIEALEPREVRSPEGLPEG